ncbi:MAG: hypothetical protein JWO13_3787 [Acidobacteriales bacterium]|nr:hypothetical protein [Terriglobales bacterium]
MVFLEEPLRLTLRERVCLLGKVALEFKPRGQGIFLLFVTYTTFDFPTLRRDSKSLPTHSRLPRPNDFIEYSNCSGVMQAPEPSF